MDKGLHLELATADVAVFCKHYPSSRADEWQPVGIFGAFRKMVSGPRHGGACGGERFGD